MRNLIPINQYIRENMEYHKTPALSLALSDRRESLHIEAFGFSNLETRRPLTENELFEIGSIGKTFTAVAVLQAFERGEIELDAPVTEYLPWFKVQSRYNPVTIHHLLTHTSGLIEGTDFSPDGRAEVWALRETETGFPPGTRFYYSSGTTNILARLLHDRLGGDPQTTVAYLYDTELYLTEGRDAGTAWWDNRFWTAMLSLGIRILPQ